MKRAREATEADPQSFHAALLLGELAGEAGKAAESAEACGRAVGLRPADAGAARCAATAYTASGRAAEALPLLRRVAETDTTAEIGLATADVLLRLGRTREATEELQRVVAQAPQNAIYMRQLAALLRKTGRPAEAADVLERAAALEPSDPWTLLTLGQIAQEAGRHDAAVARFERALAAAPDAFAAAWHLAVSREALGDGVGAAKALATYLRISEGVDGERVRRLQAKALLDAASQGAPPTP